MVWHLCIKIRTELEIHLDYLSLQVFWIYPIYCISFVLNTVMYQEAQSLSFVMFTCRPLQVSLAPSQKHLAVQTQKLVLHFFPTCQVRVVRFYVSCLLLLLLLLLRLLLPRPPLLLLLVLLVILVVLVVLRPRRPRRPCSTATRDPQCSLPDLNHDHPRPVFPAGPQPRPSTPSVPCRTSTTTIHAQCSLPDLNRDHPRPVFPAGPQPRVSPPSVPCQTSTTTIHAQCSLPDLNREYPRQKICHIECQKICQIEC